MSVDVETKRTALKAVGVSAGYGGTPVLDGVDIELPVGKVTALIGPNGCGKSTLLSVLGRQLSAQTGKVWIGSSDISALSSREFARRVSFLPQQLTVPEGISVRDLIGFGRYPYTGIFATLSREDRKIIEAAAERTGMLPFLDRPATELSGGQRQRAWVAMTMAQQSETLLLDEPTTFLDPSYQLAILDLVRELNEAGHTVAMVLHDMTQAARYADHIIAMRDGRVVASGLVDDVLTPQLVSEVFGVSCLMCTDPETGRNLPVPYQL